MGFEIHHQDCLEYLERAHPSFATALWSPPYQNGTLYQGFRDQQSTLEYLREAWALGIMLDRCLGPGASVFINLGPHRKKPELPYRYLNRFCEGGPWKVQNQIVWIKAATSLGDEEEVEFNWGHHRPNNSEGLIWSGWEWVFHLCREQDFPVALNRLALGVPYSDKSNLKRFGHARDLRCRGNVWEIPYRCNQSREHPASFPPELPERCLRLLDLPPQSRVYDPYCGVGNTGLACRALDLQFTGTDVSEHYCAIAKEKLA